jgi:hypothetical protein
MSAQGRARDGFSVLITRVNHLARFNVERGESTLYGTRHGVVRLEHGSANVLVACPFEACLVKDSVLWRDLLTLIVVEEIDLNGGCLSLAATKTANPDITIDHLVLHDGVLNIVSSRR